MTTGGSSSKMQSNASPSRSRVREVEDHELFGHFLLSPSPRSKQMVQPNRNTTKLIERNNPKKRPRSSSSLGKAYPKRDEPAGSIVPGRKKESVERSTSKRAAAPGNVQDERYVSSIEKTTDDSLENSRRYCSPSPRSYDEIIGQFAPMGGAVKMDGVPRLSNLALMAAKVYAARGKLLDLSDLADSQVHEVLGHKDMTAKALVKLEHLNPSRVNVLEASWARLVSIKFGVRKLPPRIKWWRTFYEMKRRENEISLERARARLKQRYDAADAMKKKRGMEKTKLSGVTGKRKSKPSSSTTSRIAQLRQEMKRDRRK